MKLKNALNFAAEQLAASATPQQDARLLLAHVLDVRHSYLVAHAEDQLPKEPLESFFTLVARAERQEPIPYIIGRIPFHHITLSVTPDVLIPRPETELLVEKVIAWARTHEAQTIVDVGTGSGCIAIAVAKQLPQRRLIGIDISADSLQIARANAAENDTNVTFLHGSLLEPVVEPADLIVANLPYVTAQEWTELADGVRQFEPRHALVGGEDGLDLVEELLQQAQSKLTSGGAIFLEIGWRQGAATVALAERYFPHAQVTLHQDYAGKDRIVSIEQSA